VTKLPLNLILAIKHILHDKTWLFFMFSKCFKKINLFFFSLLQINIFFNFFKSF